MMNLRERFLFLMSLWHSTVLQNEKSANITLYSTLFIQSTKGRLMTYLIYAYMTYLIYTNRVFICLILIKDQDKTAIKCPEY